MVATKIQNTHKALNAFSFITKVKIVEADYHFSEHETFVSS